MEVSQKGSLFAKSGRIVRRAETNGNICLSGQNSGFENVEIFTVDDLAGVACIADFP